MEAKQSSFGPNFQGLFVKIGRRFAQSGWTAERSTSMPAARLCAVNRWSAQEDFSDGGSPGQQVFVVDETIGKWGKAREVPGP